MPLGRAVLYKSELHRGREWQSLFAREAPHIPFRVWPDIGDPQDIRYLVAWQPPEDLTTQFPNLEVIFSIGAGVDQFNLDEIPKSIPVVRMLDPGITAGIVEYVLMAVLALHRDLPAYLRAQREQRWEPRGLVRAARRRIGVMGLGTLGQAVLSTLEPFGFPRYGWARTPREIPGVQCFAGPNDLADFLACCDILICMLPLTPATRGILNAEVFNALPAGASLINVGRGAHLREGDLLAALDSGQLSAAVLDVMTDEPPAPEHPFWQHPRILLTPHVAAVTQPESAGLALLDNVRRHESGQAMQGVIQRDLGY